MGRILVADDDPDILNIVSMTLETLGHQVTQAVNGREALDKARLIAPDLIFVDIMMPELSGYEVVVELQADERLRHIPVVGISAKAMMEDLEGAKIAGMNHYLTKPFRISQLIAIAQNYLPDSS